VTLITCIGAAFGAFRPLHNVRLKQVQGTVGTRTSDALSIPHPERQPVPFPHRMFPRTLQNSSMEVMPFSVFIAIPFTPSALIRSTLYEWFVVGRNVGEVAGDEVFGFRFDELEWSVRGVLAAGMKRGMYGRQISPTRVGGGHRCL